MSNFLKELLKGSKWVFISLVILILLVSAFVFGAWSLGWIVDQLFDMEKFNPDYYVPFGSAVLVFTLIIQIVTIILTIWALLAYGKTRNIIKKESENAK